MEFALDPGGPYTHRAYKPSTGLITPTLGVEGGSFLLRLFGGGGNDVGAGFRNVFILAIKRRASKKH